MVQATIPEINNPNIGQDIFIQKFENYAISVNGSESSIKGYILTQTKQSVFLSSDICKQLFGYQSTSKFTQNKPRSSQYFENQITVTIGKTKYQCIYGQTILKMTYDLKGTKHNITQDEFNKFRALIVDLDKNMVRTIKLFQKETNIESKQIAPKDNKLSDCFMQQVSKSPQYRIGNQFIREFIAVKELIAVPDDKDLQDVYNLDKFNKYYLVNDVCWTFGHRRTINGQESANLCDLTYYQDLKTNPDINDNEILDLKDQPFRYNKEFYPIYQQKKLNPVEPIFMSEFGLFSALMSSSMSVAKSYRMSLFALIKDIRSGDLQLVLSDDGKAKIANKILNDTIDKTLKEQLKKQFQLCKDTINEMRTMINASNNYDVEATQQNLTNNCVSVSIQDQDEETKEVPQIGVPANIADNSLSIEDLKVKYDQLYDKYKSKGKQLNALSALEIKELIDTSHQIQELQTKENNYFKGFSKHQLVTNGQKLMSDEQFQKLKTYIETQIKNSTNFTETKKKQKLEADKILIEEQLTKIRTQIQQIDKRATKKLCLIQTQQTQLYEQLRTVDDQLIKYGGLKTGSSYIIRDKINGLAIYGGITDMQALNDYNQSQMRFKNGHKPQVGKIFKSDPVDRAHLHMANRVNQYMIQIGQTIYDNSLVDQVFETIQLDTEMLLRTDLEQQERDILKYLQEGLNDILGEGQLIYNTKKIDCVRSSMSNKSSSKSSQSQQMMNNLVKNARKIPSQTIKEDDNEDEIIQLNRDIRQQQKNQSQIRKSKSCGRLLRNASISLGNLLQDCFNADTIQAIQRARKCRLCNDNQLISKDKILEHLNKKHDYEF